MCRLLNMSLYTIVLIIGDYWKHSSLSAEDMLSRTQCYGIINGASTNNINNESSHRICPAYYFFDYDKATLI